MLKMRLQRVGRIHEPSYRLVLTDSKNSTKSGRFKEILGSYDPRKTVDLIKVDRVKYWLGQGVLLTGTVHNLFVTHKIIDEKKKNVLPKKTAPKKEVAAEVPVAEKTAVAEVAVEPEVPTSTPDETTPVVE